MSSQIGMKKNDFLRQVIAYDYPTNSWEKDNYSIRDGYSDLVREILGELGTEQREGNSETQISPLRPTR